MTPEQLQLIADTLPEIQAHEDVFVAHFYEQFFLLWPETRDLIGGDVKEQGRGLVDEFIALSSSAAACDMDKFVARAHELGVRHRERGALREHYDLVEEAIIAALHGVLGERWDVPTAQAWHRLYRLMAETMLEGSSGVAFAARKR